MHGLTCDEEIVRLWTTLNKVCLLPDFEQETCNVLMTVIFRWSVLGHFLYPAKFPNFFSDILLLEVKEVPYK